jgi:hypothetical protein
MPRREKPIPRSQRISFNRGTKISRNSPAVKDDVKNFSVGLMDMDSSILYYFNEVIKPEVEVNKEKVKVPCLYASPERWAAMQRDGYLRDKKRQIITPLIVYKRTAMAKNTDIAIDKLDANKPNIFYSFEKKYTQHNRYDKFSVLQNISPGKEYYNVAMPDYVTLTYEFTIFTSYIEQMNKIVEKINYSDGAYWGEPGKMRFRTQIESFSDATEIEGEKLVKTTFGVTLYGYILPEQYNDQNTTQKYLTPKKIIIREDVDTPFEEGDTSSGAIQIGDSSTKYTSTGISGSIDITGSFETTGDFTVQGNTTINGTLTANEFHTTFTSASIMFASGSTKFGDTQDDTHEFTGSVDITGSFALDGYSVNEISNDTDLTDGSATALVTENAVKTYVEANTATVSAYLRKNFFKSSASITNATTASFTAVTASAPTGYTATSENDFVFFINGQYMEHNALAIQQKGSSLELHVHTGSIGYILESDDEILSIGKFNS